MLAVGLAGMFTVLAVVFAGVLEVFTVMFAMLLAVVVPTMMMNRVVGVGAAYTGLQFFWGASCRGSYDGDNGQQQEECDLHDDDA